MKEKIKYRRLDARDREYIAHNYAQGLSISSIARLLNVHKSTISREIKRYSHRRGYTADYAQMLANEQVQWKLEKRAKRFTYKMKQHIFNKLRTEQWSPQQIVEDCRNRGLRMVGITRAPASNFDYTLNTLTININFKLNDSQSLLPKKRCTLIISNLYFDAVALGDNDDL